MFNIIYTNQFKKDLKLVKKRNKDIRNYKKNFYSNYEDQATIVLCGSHEVRGSGFINEKTDGEKKRLKKKLEQG